MLSNFSYVWLAIYVSLENCLFRSFSQYLIQSFFFSFWYWVVWAACIFWKLILCQLFHLVLFSPILRVFFSPDLGFPCGSAGKESACNGGDLDSTPGLGRSPGEEKGYPLQYSGLENSGQTCTVHGFAKSWTQLSDFHFHFVIMFGPLSSVTWNCSRAIKVKWTSLPTMPEFMLMRWLLDHI